MNVVLYLIYKLPEIGINFFEIKVSKHKDLLMISFLHLYDVSIKSKRIMEFLNLNTFLEYELVNNNILLKIDLDLT